MAPSRLSDLSGTAGAKWWLPVVALALAAYASRSPDAPRSPRDEPPTAPSSAPTAPAPTAVPHPDPPGMCTNADKLGSLKSAAAGRGNPSFATEAGAEVIRGIFDWGSRRGRGDWGIVRLQRARGVTTVTVTAMKGDRTESRLSRLATRADWDKLASCLDSTKFWTAEAPCLGIADDWSGSALEARIGGRYAALVVEGAAPAGPAAFDKCGRLLRELAARPQ